MSVDVTVRTEIERPRDEVAEYAAAPSNAPDWYRRISSAEWQTEPPVTLGSRITFRARFLGRDLEYTYEITEYEPGEQLVMRTAQGPFPMQTTYTWQAVGDSTTGMTLRNHGDPTGFSKLTAPLLSKAMRRAMTQDLAQLKRLLETGRGRDG